MPLASSYKTADFLADGYANSYGKIDYQLDISNMDKIKDNQFDCLIACDVLEHVYDDKRALQEVFRILDSNGICIFTVPQKDNLQETYQDLSITDPKEREKAFGQFDHLRIYGNDFISMMEEAGFTALQIDELAFKKKIRERNVLFPPILSDRPLATNYRKIFIGIKHVNEHCN